MKLRTKTNIIVLFGTLIIIMVFYFLVVMFTKSALEKTFKDGQEELGRQAMEQVDRLLFNYYLNIQNIGEEEYIERMLAGGLTDERVAEKRIKELLLLTGPWDVLEIVDTEGVFITSSLKEHSGKNISGGEVEIIKATEEALQGHMYYSDFLISKDTGKPTLIFTAPVRDQEKANSPVVGAVLGQVTFSAINEIINDIGLVGHKELFTKDGTLIALDQGNTTETLFSKNQAVVNFLEKRSLILQEENNNFTYEPDAISSLSISRGYLDYKGNTWALLIETPRDIALDLVSEVSFKIMLVVLPIALLILSFILFLLNRLIIRPVINFTEDLEMIAKGDLAKLTEIKSENEIGELSASFNKVATNLHEFYAALDKKIKEKTVELSNKITETERSKSAILNLLEDFKEEKKLVESTVAERTRGLSSDKARILAAIDSLNFGFIVADVNHRLLLRNKAVMTLLELYETDEVSIDRISGLLGNFNIRDKVPICMKDKTMCETKEIAFKNKTLRSIISPILTPGNNEVLGYVLLFEDVTKAK